ncbi:hypothetical protein D3C74_506640 [compost metagenome]
MRVMIVEFHGRQVLLDPFEKQFNLPAAAINFTNVFGGKLPAIRDDFVHFSMLILKLYEANVEG